MDETMVNETTVDEATVDDFYYAENEKAGLLDKVVIGGIAVAAGIAGGAIIKNQGKIKDFIGNKREQRRQKKVAQTMAKLAKLESKAPKTAEETEKEE